MRADRLLSILLLVESRGVMSAVELAELLEVSRRTIYRDIDALSTAGVPIYAERGRRGGIRLLDGYGGRITRLTTAEASALLVVDVDDALSHVGVPTQAAMRGRLKIAAGLPRSTASPTQLSSRIHVDPAGWFSAPPSRELPVIAGALFDDRRLSIRYSRRDGRDVQRTLEPWGLVLKQGAWFLVAAVSGQPPHVYRVSRVRDAQRLEERSSRPQDFDLARFWHASSSEFEKSFSTLPVRVRVGPEGGRALRQVLGERVVEMLQSAETDEDGAKVLTLHFESVDQAVVFLLGSAASVEVIEPDAVRRGLLRGARTALELYRSTIER